MKSLGLGFICQFDPNSMKPKRNSLLRLSFPIVAISMVLSTGASNAATQTYLDSNVLNTWNATDANWDAGVTWTNGNDAVFGGTGETVTVTTATANSITFNSAGYTLTGGTITLGAAPTTITTSSDATIASALSTTSGITKAGTGVLTFNNRKTYTGNTTINAGVLDLTGGGGDIGTIRGSATVNATGTLRLSTGDATGYNVGATALSTINLNGGTLSNNTTANQTLGSATVNMTGGSITGVANSNIDFFNGASTLNSLASATTSTISGTRINLRQNGGVTFTVADGAAVPDLAVSSVISNSAFTANNFTKAGPGTMTLSSASTYGTETLVTGGRLTVTGTLRSTSALSVSSGAILELNATNIFTAGHGTAMGNSRVITANGGTILMGPNFDARFGNVTLNNGGTWTSNRTLTNYDALLANTDTGAATIRVTGTGASTMNGTGGIRIQGIQNFEVADVTASSATDLTVSMVLSTTGTQGGANGGINKTGLGTMAITSNSTFLGTVTVNAGTLLGAAGNSATGAIGSASSVIINNGGTAAVGGDNSFVGGTTSGAKTIQVNTGGVLSSPGSSTNHLHAIVLNGGTMSATSSNATYASWNPDFGISTLGNGSTSTISGGNLALTQTGGTVFNIGTGDTLNVSTLIARVTGAGDTGLIKNGAGTLNLSAANTYTSPTSINAGSIVLASTAALPSTSVTVAGGALFDVSALPAAYPRPTGTILTAGRTTGFATDVNGSVAINGGTINIAGVAPSAGTLSLNGNLSFASGFVKFDLANLTTSGGGVNDQIAITGDLSLGGLTDIVVNKLNGALTSGSYTLMTYTGSLTGNESNLQVTGAVGGTTRQSFTLDTTSTPGSVLLTVAGSSAVATWTGSDPTTPGVWDVNLTDNWTSSIPDLRYFDGDNVVFDNTAATFTVDLPDVVIPGTVTFNNSLANPYVLGGIGAISGLTGLTKNGDGNVGITLTNSFTGSVAINAGSITVGTLTNSTVSGPLGAGSLITLGDATQTGTLIYTGATATANRPITAAVGGGALNVDTSGVTLTQSGAITLGGTLTKTGAGDLTLTATASGTGGLAVSSGTLVLNAAQTYTGGTTVNGGTLLLDGNQNFNRLANNSSVTVNNTGLFEVRGVNALPSAANSVDFTVAQGGVLRFVSGGSTATGPTGISHNHLRNLTLTGGTLDLTYSGTGTAYNNESVQLNGNVTVGGSTISTIQTSTTDALSGLALSGARTFTVADVTVGTDLLVNAEVENMDIAGGALIKAGEGTMVLAGTNTYTGNTTVNAGTLGITGKLYKVGYTTTPVVQVSGGTLDLTSWGFDTNGSLGELANANARVVLNGGTINISGNSETSGRGFTLNAAGGSFLMGTAGQTLTISSHVETTTLAISGPLNLGGEGNMVVEKVLTGTASLTKVGGGTVTLSGINTYSGNIAVNGGNLTIADNAGLRFVVTNSSSNGVSGTGTLVVNGDFTIDTAAVTNTTGTWTLVNASTLSESFGSTFTITGSGWTEASNVWTKTEGTKLWTFTEATGVLTLSVANSFNTWIAGYDFSAFPGADLTATGDADGDGIPNAVEFVIGNLPNQTKVENLPTAELVTDPAGVTAGEYLKFTFRRSTASVDAGVTSTAQYDTDLAGTWTPAVNAVAGVEIVVVANPSIPGDNVEVYIPRSLAVDGKLFGRVSVSVPPAP